MMSSPASSEPPTSPMLTVHDWLVRRRLWIVGLVLAHFVLAHYFVLGFVSWDGFGHRLPPVVELVQHGGLGREKYFNWALVGFRPFVELTQAPLLSLFGMEGFYFSFALFLFPFCLAGIYSLSREVSRDDKAAFYAAGTYLLTPLVNAQLSSGYIDWAISGLLAFFLYSVLSIRRSEATDSIQELGAYAKIALGTFLFSMSRQQAPYLAVFFFSIAAGLVFVEWHGGLRITRRRRLAAAVVAFLIGLAPAAVLHTQNYLQHGSPIHPYQFQFLGLKLGEGASIQSHPSVFGLEEYSIAGLTKASVRSWLVPARWPFCFFDGRDFGSGLFFITALLSLPITFPRANWPTRILLASLLVASLAGKDFWNPRFAYAVILGICVCNGLAFSAFLERPRRAPLYVALAGVFLLHAFRPEWEAYRIRQGDGYVRMNVSGSRSYMDGGLDVVLYPDMNANLVIADVPGNNFILPLFGRRLTNKVLGSVAPSAIGPACEGLHTFDRPDREVLVVDDGDLTKACPRTCVATQKGRCLAWRLER